ncbi:MAG: DMT family transporter [Chloroflexi bacterium]|nr:DMT family transporter [Chloroflexota bacterium]
MPGEIFALIGAMLFGAGHVAVRRAHDDGWSTLNVLLSVGAINAGSYVVLVVAEAWLNGRFDLTLSALLALVAAGGLTSLLGRSALWSSIAYIGAARAASYRVTSPVITVAMAYLMLGERVQPRALAGAGVVVLGLWLLSAETGRGELVLPPKGRSRRGVAIGIGLGMTAAIFFGAGQVYRKLGVELGATSMTGALVGSGVALAAFVATSTRQRQWTELARAHQRSFPWPIVLAGLLTTASQYCIFYAYERSRVSTASVLGATEPVWSLLVGTLLMRRQEQPSWKLAASIAIICGGSALVVGTA